MREEPPQLRQPSDDPERDRAEDWANDAMRKVRRADDAGKLTDWAKRNAPSIDKLPKDLGTMIYEAVAERRKALQPPT